MNMTVPTVTVTIPVFNCENFITHAIDSVLNQSFNDYELIIIDNCSTDGTVSKVRQYKDSRIRFVVNDDNIGAERNWNKALGMANGRYFKLLCADDVLYSNCLEEQVAIFDNTKNRDISMVSCKRAIINEIGQIKMIRGFPFTKGNVDGKSAIRRCVKWGTNLIGESGSVLLRKTDIERVGLFNASIPYLIDLDYWSRVLLLGNLYYINKPLCAFRVSKNSWSANIGKKQSIQMSTFIDKLDRTSKYGIGSFDKICGKLMSGLNAFLRNLFFRLF